MKKMQVMIAVLLIVAVVFSVASLVMSFSVGDFENVDGSEEEPPMGESTGNMNLVIETSEVGGE